MKDQDRRRGRRTHDEKHSSQRGRKRVTRRQAADILGVSTSMVRKYEHRRRLTRMRDPNGHVLLYLDEVNELVRERGTGKTPSGAVGAEILRLVRDGFTAEEIAMETGYELSQIDPLYRRYHAARSSGEREARDRREHEERMRELEEELAELRRRINRGDDEQEGDDE